ncbi:MAG TPA: DUF1311 domain-containing protein [Candidatus Enterocloster excrementipullorum]|uniref:DUF1311 domain-containing protein n=1 Tax=Candidatus Enterocloster excrementipullorum TaxID=2838559 RepID=A0A9D2SHI9_9FIRM|nr:DUF1311 domain-containing protein [Candidatus Enterocloster excrementipullorum]
MRDKRIWIVIACILVIGSGLTKYTHSFVSRSGGSAGGEAAVSMAAAGEYPAALADSSPAASALEQEAAAQAGGGQGPGLQSRMAPGPGEASDQAAAGEAGTMASVQETAAAADGEAVPEAAAFGAAPATASPKTAGGDSASESPDDAGTEGTAADIAADAASAPEETTAADEPISPLVGARPAERSSGSGTDYRQRLEDLDAQIERIQKEEQESNVYSIITSAESELKMWESELNTIYTALLAALSQEDAAGLAQEQQEWMQNREAKAAESSGKGGSMESLGYAAALVSITRDRAYELVERYEDTVSAS